MLNQRIASLILSFCVAFSTFFSIANVKASEPTYRAAQGLWSGQLQCRSKDRTKHPSTWRVDLVVNSDAVTESGRTVRPPVFANIYVQQGGKLKLHSRAVFDAKVNGNSIALKHRKGRIRQTPGSLVVGGRNILVANLPVCGRKLSKFKMKRFAVSKKHKEVFGVWSGDMEGCQFAGSPVSVTARFMPFNGKAILLDIGYDADTNRYGKLSGRVIFEGVFNRTARAFTFKTIYNDENNGWTGKKRVGTNWLPKTAKFDFEDPGKPGDKMFAEIGSCPFGEFNRIKQGGQTPVALVQKPIANAGVVSIKSLVGEWQGQAVCTGRREQISQFSLFVEKTRGERIYGHAYYYAPDIVSNGMHWGRVVGRLSTKGEGYQFIIDGRAQGVPQKLQKFAVKQSATPDRIQVSFNESSCQPVAMRRMTKNDPSRRVLIKANQPKGLFFSKRRPLDRCQVLVDWIYQLKREYPDINWRRTPLNKLRHKLVALFSDESFIPVFGKPYDQTSKNERAAPGTYIDRICWKDALMKEDVRDFSLISGPMRFGPEYTWGFHYYAVEHAVREIRKIKALISARSSQPLKTPDQVIARMGDLTAAQKLVNRENSILWPSDRKAANLQLEMRIARLSDALIGSLVGPVASQSDPVEKLREARLLSASAEAKFKNLSPTVKSALAGKSQDFQRQALAELTNLYTAKLGQLPNSQAGLDSLKNLTREHDKLKGMLLPGVNNPIKGKIAKRKTAILAHLAAEFSSGFDVSTVSFVNLDQIDQRLEQIRKRFGDEARTDAVQKLKRDLESRYLRVVQDEVTRRIALLNVIPAGVEGLKATSQWKQETLSAFKGIKTKKANNAIEAAYQNKRQTVLKGSLAEYENQIIGLPNDQRKALLKSYLPTPADRRTPVALQYLLIANGN